MRDNYVRESKKIKSLKSGSGASTKTKYIYFNRLTFLQPTISKNVTDTNFEMNDRDDETPNTSLGNVDDSIKSPKQKQSAKRIKLHPADEYFANIIEKNLNRTEIVQKKKKEEEDEDKLFCLSLYREIKKVPESMRLKLKIDIYNLILQKQSTQLQPLEPISKNYPVETPSSRNYPVTSYRQQNNTNMPHSAYSQYGYNTNPYDNHSYSQKNNIHPPCTNVQNEAVMVVSVPAPSPSLSSPFTNENSQDSSEIDLFDL